MTYLEWKKLPHKDWVTEPISPTCQVCLVAVRLPDKPIKRKLCEVPTSKVYPSLGNGWMALCEEHGRKHTEAFDVCELIEGGERWE